MSRYRIQFRRFLFPAACSLFLVAAAAIFSRASLHAGTSPEAEIKDYTAHVQSTYDYRFGKDTPFLPSNATTATGDFIPAKDFPTAQYCGHCHQEAYHQWRESLHSNSFRSPSYLNNVKLLYKQQGVEYSRHCEGCHNPTALLSGGVTSHPFSKDRGFDKDGISCSVCHSIQKLQPSFGLGSYVMGVPSAIVDENGNPIPGEVPDKMIMEHTDRHVQAVMKDFYKTPEYCGACHKANLPDTLNNYKWLRAIGLYDEWQASSMSHRSPLPFYQKDYSACQTCHMQKEAISLPDYGAKNNQLASHRWLGGNTTVPTDYGFKDQVEKTTEFLKKNVLNVDLFAIRQGDGPYVAPLGSVNFNLKPNDPVETVVVIQNKGMGHTLVPEQRDAFEAWVEFSATDATGRELLHSGGLDKGGFVDPTAHTFTNKMLDENGNYLYKHEVWKRHTIAVDTTIRPGRSTIVRYQFRVPADAKGPITITAKVNYRHLNEAFTRFVEGEHHREYPIVEMASRTRTLQVGDNQPEKPSTTDNPDWMRWNNFGIALFDQMQYPLSVNAFQHVVKMRPDYADGYTNLGLVYTSWEKYPDADKNLAKALELSPGNPRALYYQALVERKEGNLDGAIANLEKVTTAYPQSPDAHRELGYTYYILNQYDKAEKQYLAVQQIDPDDLAAHYILAIVYRRLGKKPEAAREAALFANEKDDPMSSTRTLEYLAKHPETSIEAVPWHIHSSVNESGQESAHAGGSN